MHHRHLFMAVIVGICAVMSYSGSARADAVLYDSANFIEGNQSFVQSFTISSPGTVTVSLSSVPWLDTIANLSCFLTSGSSVVAPTMGTGTETLSLETGTYFAHWFGDANGQYGIGVSELKVMFQPTASTVPLPGTFLLLLVGLGVLFGWQHRGNSNSHTLSSKRVLMNGSHQTDMLA